MQTKPSPNRRQGGNLFLKDYEALGTAGAPAIFREGPGSQSSFAEGCRTQEEQGLPVAEGLPLRDQRAKLVGSITRLAAAVGVTAGGVERCDHADAGVAARISYGSCRPQEASRRSSSRAENRSGCPADFEQRPLPSTGSKR
eukprot:5124995-Amphidinium_carterae.3